LISYRPFRNLDPPRIAALWQNQPPLDGLAPVITPDTLNELVFSKPYFDPAGLQVACDDQRMIGFVHAGFGPTKEQTSLDRRRGVISMLMVSQQADVDSAAVSAELLERGEAYLRQAGSIEIFAMGIGELCPFYLGLYGQGDLPGVLQHDSMRQALFRAHDYQPAGRVVIFERELIGFRSPVDRRQLQIRRGSTLSLQLDPPPATWWEACTKGCFELLRTELVPAAGGPPLASATFWSTETVAIGSPICEVRLAHIEAHSDRRRSGLATYLLSESLRVLYEQGFPRVTSQINDDDTASAALFKKLGFVQIGAADVLRK